MKVKMLGNKENPAIFMIKEPNYALQFFQAKTPEGTRHVRTG